MAPHASTGKFPPRGHGAALRSRRQAAVRPRPGCCFTWLKGYKRKSTSRLDLEWPCLIDPHLYVQLIKIGFGRGVSFGCGGLEQTSGAGPILGHKLPSHQESGKLALRPGIAKIGGGFIVLDGFFDQPELLIGPASANEVLRCIGIGGDDMSGGILGRLPIAEAIRNF